MSSAWSMISCNVFGICVVTFVSWLSRGQELRSGPHAVEDHQHVGMVDDLVHTDLQQGAVAGRTDQHLAVVPEVPDRDGIPIGV